MCEPCKPGKALKEYKWCRCMSSCGSVEDKYWIYDKNSINALHLISELYDDKFLNDSSRRWYLTEKHYEIHKQDMLVPQVPYP